jgi:hypothetical protein
MSVFFQITQYSCQDEIGGNKLQLQKFKGLQVEKLTDKSTSSQLLCFQVLPIVYNTLVEILEQFKGKPDNINQKITITVNCNNQETFKVIKYYTTVSLTKK